MLSDLTASVVGVDGDGDAAVEGAPALELEGGVSEGAVFGGVGIGGGGGEEAGGLVVGAVGLLDDVPCLGRHWLRPDGHDCAEGRSERPAVTASRHFSMVVHILLYADEAVHRPESGKGGFSSLLQRDLISSR